MHVEYEWRLLHEDLDESDDDVDEKLQVGAGPSMSMASVMRSVPGGSCAGIGAESCWRKRK